MACGKISGLFRRDKQYGVVKKWFYGMPYMITALPHGGVRYLEHSSCNFAFRVSVLAVVVEPCKSTCDKRSSSDMRKDGNLEREALTRVLR